MFLKSIGYKDINYDIPVCHECHEGHEGHESHEGLGTWYMSEWHSVLWTPLQCIMSFTVKVQELFCNIMSSIWHWYKMVKSAFQILEDAILLWRYIILAKFWEIFGKVLAERIISINPLFSVKSFLWKALLTIITCNQKYWWSQWSDNIECIIA